MSEKNEIVMYQPESGEFHIEVRVENESVWLNRSQIALLFDRDVKTIGKHIHNALKEELAESPTVANFATVQNEGGRLISRMIEYYNLDMVLSVGYRVKSTRGIKFRQWATGVLRDRLLCRSGANQQLQLVESRLEAKIDRHSAQISDIQEKVDFFVRTSLPPVEGVFCEGQVFDAWAFASNLVRLAKRSIVLIDNFVDDSTLKLLEKRAEGVSVDIYTRPPRNALDEDLRRFQQQFYPIPVHFTAKAHDRFLLIDDTVYFVGASFKDLGKKLFAFAKLSQFTCGEILQKL
ncbi:virulence RhuM family protein [Fibrobacter sp.]|uniref:virulence RhuM family protein n=1 Tax=Fibrobacter sp. TaxID=35828 RepID=UPI00388F05DC